MITLFDTEEEFRSFISVNTGFTFENIKPKYNEALTDYIFPYCSREQFDESLNSENAKDIEFIRLVKNAAANLGFYLYYPFSKAQLSDKGIIYDTEKNKQASAEDKEDIEMALKRSGLTGIETMLDYLEQNDEHFTIWKASSSYTKHTSLLVRTAAEFKIIDNSRQVFMKLVPFIEDIEFDVIKEAVPKVILQKLYSRDFGVESEVKAAYKELLEKYIQVIVRSFSMAQAINAFAVIKDKYNTLTVYDDTTASKTKGHKEAPDRKLDKWREDLLILGNKRLKMLQTFIDENAELFDYTPAEKVIKTIPYKNDPSHGTAYF